MSDRENGFEEVNLIGNWSEQDNVIYCIPRHKVRGNQQKLNERPILRRGASNKTARLVAVRT